MLSKTLLLLAIASCVCSPLAAAGPAMSPVPQQIAPGPEPVPEPEPDPAPEDWPVDPKTAKRILDYLNGAKEATALADETGLGVATAKEILELRSMMKGDAFTSLANLNSVWSTNYSAFALMMAMCGPATMGRWDLMPYSLPWSPVNSVMLKNGLVLLYEEANTPNTLLWDPTDQTVGTLISPDNSPTVSQWCSHTVQLSDGRILSVGGAGGGPNSNSDQAHIFDPDAGTNGVWTQIGDMNFERWYPTVVAMGYPNSLIVGGVQGNFVTVKQLEIYNEITNTFTVVPGPASELEWDPTYPGLQPIPTGQIVFTRTGFWPAPPTPTSQFFTWDDFTNPVTGTWVNLGPMNFDDRIDGISITFLTPTDDPEEQKARVGVFGGGKSDVTARRTAEIIDAENLLAGDPWTALPNMTEDRIHCQGILMPDGKAVLFGGLESHGGGGTGSLTSDIFDPCTDTFTTADSLTYARGYHAVAALLPSGQVMAAGGVGFGGAADLTIEVFNPPYLFRGPRPTITSVPSLVHHGSSFDIDTPDATKIEKVVLVRPVSYTHQTESEQRVLQLEFTRDAANDRVTATAPDGIHPHPHAPRGYYMLFILDCDGIPSVGQFVHLH